MNCNNLSIGMLAPNFTALTTLGIINMSDYTGKWVIFFNHPGDFTPVCTTEFVAFAQANSKFAERNAQLLGLSIDSNPSHLEWVYSIYQTTGVTIPFPIIADRTGAVAQLYGMIAPMESNIETVRNVFIIDPHQVVRAILIYPNTNGRSIPEILRLLIALQTTEEYKVLTPANWLPGQPTMVPAARTYSDLLGREEDPEASGLYCKDWYWCYNQPPENKENNMLSSNAEG